MSRAGSAFPQIDASLLLPLAQSLDYDLYQDVGGMLTRNHAFWSALLPATSRGGDALVLENRLGALTVQLARSFRRVYSLSASTEDAEMTRQLLAKTAIANVNVLTPHDMERADLSGLRAVVVFGSSVSANGKAAVPASLVDCICASADAWLASDGVLVIADNNALSYRRWKLRDRRRAAIGRWSISSLIQQARRAGRQIRCFVNRGELTMRLLPPPEYMSVEDSNGTVGLTLKERLLHSRWGKHRWPSYLCFQSRQLSQSKTVLDDIVCASGIGARAGWAATDTVEVKRLIAGHGDIAIAIVGPAVRPDADVIMRLPSSVQGVRRCEANAAALRHLAGTSLATQVPHLLGVGTYADQAYYAETRCPGAQAEDAGVSSDAALNAACTLLASFHRHTAARSVLSPELCDEIVGANFSGLRMQSEPVGQARLDAIQTWLTSQLTGRSIYIGFTHGDFKLGNLLFAEGTSRPCIIDWDCSRLRGFPFLDYLMLLTYKIGGDLGGRLGSAYIDHILPWRLAPADARIGDQVLGAMDVAREEFLALRVLLWFSILRDRQETFLKFHPVWRASNVMTVLDHMETEIDRIDRGRQQ